ncbi:MAG: alanine racemase [Oscillospiraceae bacterium]|nr:alanine racemase [Oscillospiraceae bacterium]
MRRCYAEVSLDNIAWNYRWLRSRCGVRVCGVVKANAYGHGAVKVARRLEAEGCDFFAVATIDEALELRDSGIGCEILVFGVTDPRYADVLAARGFTQTIASMELAEAYNSALTRLRLKCHLKIDTGMTRLGIGEFERFNAKRFQNLEVDGAFTHLSVSDECNAESDDYTRTQIARFREIAPSSARVLHCANSGGVCRHAESYAAPYNLVRPGIALYGHFAGAEGLKPAMTWKARVCRVRDVPAGTAVGYGRTWVVPTARRIAVLSVGYGDGFSRMLSNRGSVWIAGQRAPIVGRVCMDLTMVDVTEVEGVRELDEAELFGEHITVEEVANRLGTITYEVLCGVSARVPRIHV